jgi:hypothetical protein
VPLQQGGSFCARWLCGLPEQTGRTGAKRPLTAL